MQLMPCSKPQANHRMSTVPHNQMQLSFPQVLAEAANSKQGHSKRPAADEVHADGLH